jgi:hypothetical protein
LLGNNTTDRKQQLKAQEYTTGKGSALGTLQATHTSGVKAFENLTANN